MPDFVIDGKTPKQAALLVLEVATHDTLHMIGTFAFESSRREVRALLKRYITSFGKGYVHREFTSATQYELRKLAPHTSNWVIPSYYDEDVESYKAWLKGQEQQTATCATNYFDSPTNHTEETTMMPKANTTKLFEKKVFVNGVDASTLTDDQIFHVIKQAEAEIEGLELINNKPEKLGKKIAKLQKAIDKVRQYVDER